MPRLLGNPSSHDHVDRLGLLLEDFVFERLIKLVAAVCRPVNIKFVQMPDGDFLLDERINFVSRKPGPVYRYYCARKTAGALR